MFRGQKKRNSTQNELLQIQGLDNMSRRSRAAGEIYCNFLKWNAVGLAKNKYSPTFGSIQGSGDVPTLPWVRFRVCVGGGLGLV